MRETARPVCAADGGQRKKNRARLLRPHTWEATEQGEATPGGSRGGKGLTQGEQPLGGRGSDTEPKYRVDPNNGCASDDERPKSLIIRRGEGDRRPKGGRHSFIITPTASRRSTPTISFRLLYGLLLLHHDRRQILWLGVAAHPTAEWISHQLTEAYGGK